VERAEVAIVGAGPVGLTLACLLVQRGVSVAVLEKRDAPTIHSRAIGIHPPALDVFDALGVGQAMRDAGVSIGGGQVFLDGRLAGRLPLANPPLSLPQSTTEAILETKLCSLSPGSLLRGASVTGLENRTDSVVVSGSCFEPISAKLVVGCDGANGAIRALAGIERFGGPHPDRYLMGDFADDTKFGSDAALFFGRGGIVESFPLPENRRRWVARLDSAITDSSAEILAEIISSRTGRMIPVETCSWLSPFGVQSFLAERFSKGRFALAGDAAHVVSPIGGQGMNLGILGAANLAPALNGEPESLTLPLAAHRRLALTVGRRAAFNTAMGRPISSLSLKRSLIRAILASPPLTRRFAQVFAMRDLAPL
jgi:2-polyprenyl-6-methoxyphenol hydroxylase-like FAD-dependent oxidoreductase